MIPYTNTHTTYDNSPVYLDLCNEENYNVITFLS